MIPTWILSLVAVMLGIAAVIALYFIVILAYAYLRLPARRYGGSTWREF